MVNTIGLKLIAVDQHNRPKANSCGSREKLLVNTIGQKLIAVDPERTSG